MKKLAVALVLVSACRTVPVTNMGGSSQPGPGPGAVSPQAAVEQMLAAAKAQDLQAISAVWGDEHGLMRDRTPRNEVESRTFILACILRADTQKVGAAEPAGNGHMLVNADLTQGGKSGSTRFEVAATAQRRWLVTNVDVQSLQNAGFCGRKGD
jgi:hypothetical protein